MSFKHNGLEEAEAALNERLIRKRKSKLSLTSFGAELRSIFCGSLVNRKMALKTENIIGIISFAALNLLLLFLNSIDVHTFWLGNLENLVGKDYSAELHEGTNALIFSIVMAMQVILYFFSGNLNFFSKNKTIRILAYLWIIQNVFLVSSVFLRDFNYIAMHGLTYKRIGVIVFLLLCTIGLFTVYIKVAKQKTFFYLCKINGLIWYVLLLAFGVVNWDVAIVSYNIENRKTIDLDLDHLTNMSDKTLPLLDKNRTILKAYIPDTYSVYEEAQTMAVVDSTGASTTATEAVAVVVADTVPVDTAKLAREHKQKCIEAFDDDLDFRIARFKKSQQNLSWLSWNYRDWQTSMYFKTKK